MPFEKPAYRPEIDGLRAIAILAVLGFHLDLPGFHGGFVGVDVFFVISGYLITRNIQYQINCNTFSLKQFYVGRIRRLFPALLATIAATLLVSLLVLTPEHLERAATVALGSIFSVSNFIFWLESGYFDEAKQFKPLLHTWSLAVEEQFYLMWPFLLLALTAMAIRRRLMILSLMALLSLLAATWSLEGHASTAFYMMPFRLWEFAMGACLVWMNTRINHAVASTVISLTGVALILTPVVAYSATTPFPGATALLPCLGAAMLISQSNRTWPNRLLCAPASVLVGKLSYSLYLVHWPVITLFAYWKLGGIGLKSLLVILPIIFALSWLLHQFVEQRFRTPVEMAKRQRRRALGFGATAAVAILALAVSYGHGWPWRYSADAAPVLYAVQGLQHVDDEKRQLLSQIQNAFDNDAEEKHLIIGDSFAEDTLLMLRFFDPSLNISLLRVPAECQPIQPLTAVPSGAKPSRCDQARSRAYNSELIEDTATIYLAASWREPAFSHLENSIRSLNARSDAQIILVGARPSFLDVPTLVIKHGKIDGLNGFLNSFRNDAAAANDTILRAIARRTGSEFLSMMTLICPDNTCPVISPLDGRILFTDHAHFSVSGARYFADQLATVRGYSRNRSIESNPQ